jgi:PAS domain S-box-containing protein
VGGGSPAGGGPTIGGSEELLHRALAATTSGVSIAAFDQPDQPLVYVNEAFAAMAGFPLESVLGGNCRFLQGADTDPAAVGRIRSALAAGRECRETLLNYRGPERTPWWNEVWLSPVTDADGRVVQYIGVQNDVTERVQAQRALAVERDRAASYLAKLERSASTDPLTGLANRRGMEDRLERAMLETALDDGSALAVLFLDLDGFKQVNDQHGHAVGDQLLRRTAERLTARLRRGDLLAPDRR